MCSSHESDKNPLKRNCASVDGFKLHELIQASFLRANVATKQAMYTVQSYCEKRFLILNSNQEVSNGPILRNSLPINSNLNRQKKSRAEADPLGDASPEIKIHHITGQTKRIIIETVHSFD